MKLLLLLVLCAVPYVAWEEATGLQPFDDEGTLMFALAGLQAGFAPYRDVFSLYGPGYLVLFGTVFHKAGLPLTHDVVRMTSGVFWLVSAAALGYFCGKITKSRLATAMGFLVALFLLVEFSYSPLHPQEVSFLLLIVLVFLVGRGAHNMSGWVFFSIGVILALLSLIKINLGLYAAVPIALLLLNNLASMTWGRRLYRLFRLAPLALPVLVMMPLFAHRWAVFYCLFAMLVIAGTLIITTSIPAPMMFTPRNILFFSGGALACLALVMATIMAWGATPADIIGATLLNTARWIHEWYVPFKLEWWAWPNAITALVCAYCYQRFADQTAITDAMHGLKLLLGCAGLAIFCYLAVRHMPHPALIHDLVPALAPWAWLVAVSAPGQGREEDVLRSTFGLLAAILVLYPFPVAGGQLIMAGLFPAIMLGVLVHDGWRHFVRRCPRLVAAWPPRRGWQRLLGAGIGLAMIGVPLAAQTQHAWSRHSQAIALDQPGARLIRARAKTVADYHAVLAQLRGCGQFFPFPAQLSLYLWAGRQPPSWMQTNNPLALLSTAQQAHLIADLDRFVDLCVVEAMTFQAGIFDRGQWARKPALARYWEKGFEEIGVHGPFRILRRLPPG